MNEASRAPASYCFARHVGERRSRSIASANRGESHGTARVPVEGAPARCPSARGRGRGRAGRARGPRRRASSAGSARAQRSNHWSEPWRFCCSIAEDALEVPGLQLERRADLLEGGRRRAAMRSARDEVGPLERGLRGEVADLGGGSSPNDARRLLEQPVDVAVAPLLHRAVERAGHRVAPPGAGVAEREVARRSATRAAPQSPCRRSASARRNRAASGRAGAPRQSGSSTALGEQHGRVEPVAEPVLRARPASRRRGGARLSGSRRARRRGASTAASRASAAAARRTASSTRASSAGASPPGPRGRAPRPRARPRRAVSQPRDHRASPSAAAGAAPRRASSRCDVDVVADRRPVLELGGDAALLEARPP